MVEIENKISQNGSILKLGSLVLIITGHYFKDFPWYFSWFAIFNFSFLSGYFTYIKYNDNFKWKVFYIRKLNRLGVDLIVINTFLLMLFSIQGKDNILTWKTFLGFTGLNGFLSYFFIPNPSPFRIEIWFLTTLLIFYIIFPALLLLYRNKVVAALLALVILLLAGYLNEKIKYDFALWLAICGFICSGAYARQEISIIWKSGASIFLIISVVALILYSLDIPLLDFWLIFFISLSFLLFFIDFPIHPMFYRSTQILSGCLLEVYLIHRYLFIHMTGYTFFDYGISLLLIFLVAVGLKAVSRFLYGIFGVSKRSKKAGYVAG
jgi:hypothetical protein